MKWTLLVVVVVMLAGLGGALGFFWPFGSKNAIKLPGVVEIQEIRLASKAGGRIAELYVSEGQTVEAGQRLVRLDVPELKAQHAQAKAQLDQARAALAKAERGPRPEELDAAHAALMEMIAAWIRLENGPRPEEIRMAQSEYDAAAADLKLAREDLERLNYLRTTQRGAVNDAEFDLVRAAEQRARGRENAARARLDLARAGTRVEELSEGKARLQRHAASYALMLAGTRQEDIDEARAKVTELEARIAELDARLAEEFVVAPSKAMVEVLPVRVGDVVAPNQPIVRILRAEEVWVKVFVPETELAKVRKGEKVQVTLDGYKERFDGVVIQVQGESEFTPRNVQSADERRYQVFGVKVRVNDTKGIFKSGMAAEVHLPLRGAGE
jgi:multidrug resistance efflux pump